MPLSAQLNTRAELVEFGHEVLALDPGFYILQCSPWQTPAAGYHRAGSWHIYPSRTRGLALDLNWKDPHTGSRAREHEMLQRAALIALRRGFSITFPLTPGDNARGTVANHCGANLHLHIDCGSYSNLGDRTPAKGGAVTASVVGSAVGYLVGRVGTVSRVLRKGDRGANVKALQRYLGVKADGVFGRKTERALKAWQRRYHLHADGKWGPACREARDVLHAQWASGAKQDGKDGPKTRAAVKATQRRLGVKADGEWGPKTEAAYQAFVDGILGKGTIRAWQRNARTPVDGKISRPSTLIRKVQRHGSKSKNVRPRYRLTGREVDGRLGPDTWAMLQDLMGIKITRRGDKHTVKALQRRILRGRY